MKNLVASLCIMLICFSAKADIFVYHGDTIFVSSDLLQKHPKIANIKSQLQGFKPEQCFDCYPRLYDAVWNIENNSLYLAGIYSTNATGPKLQADLHKIFNTTDDKIKAVWVTAELWLPIGKEVGRSDMMNAFYSGETYLDIKKGKVEKVEHFDYPTAKTSKILANPELASQFIYSRITWSKNT